MASMVYVVTLKKSSIYKASCRYRSSVYICCQSVPTPTPEVFWWGTFLKVNFQTSVGSTFRRFQDHQHTG